MSPTVDLMLSRINQNRQHLLSDLVSLSRATDRIRQAGNLNQATLRRREEALVMQIQVLHEDAQTQLIEEETRLLVPLDAAGAPLQKQITRLDELQDRLTHHLAAQTLGPKQSMALSGELDSIILRSDALSACLMDPDEYLRDAQREPLFREAVDSFGKVVVSEAPPKSAEPLELESVGKGKSSDSDSDQMSDLEKDLLIEKLMHNYRELEVMYEAVLNARAPLQVVLGPSKKDVGVQLERLRPEIENQPCVRGRLAIERPAKNRSIFYESPRRFDLSGDSGLKNLPKPISQSNQVAHQKYYSEHPSLCMESELNKKLASLEALLQKEA